MNKDQKEINVNYSTEGHVDDVERLLAAEINEAEGCGLDVLPGEGDTLYMGIDCEWQTNIETKSNNVLCYTASVMLRDEHKNFIVYTKSGKRSDRLSLEKFLGHVVHQAKKDHFIELWPKNIVVFCHFMRADIVNFKDFWDVKQHTTAINGTVISLGLGNKSEGESKKVSRSTLVLRDQNRKGRLSQVKLVDTMTLSPFKSLAKIAQFVDLEKIEIPNTHCITEMKKFLHECPEEFEEYAIRDAEIALLYGLKIKKILEEEFGLNHMPATIGSAAVTYFVNNFGDEDEL
jgi:hypothetical protein